jgi:hypothetical protein
MSGIDLWSPAVGSRENKRRRRITMWKEYAMAKEWNEFWRRSNEFDYEGTAGGEHNTMIRRANELHGQMEPIDWKKFKATNIYDKEVYGMYGDERIAVSRLDYDAYAAPEHHEVVTTEDGEVRGYVLGNELRHAELQPIEWDKFEATDIFDEEVYGIYEEQFIAVSRLDYDAYCEAAQHCEDMELLKAQESGLYDYDYGSYMEKKQLNETTDIKEDKSTDTYMHHSNSLYKETPMNHNTLIDANNAVSGDTNNAIRPSHYASSNPDVPPIQMWDYALSQNLGFFEGNIIKYVSRWRNKGGVQDLQKAMTYLQRLIDSHGSPKP